MRIKDTPATPDLTLHSSRADRFHSSMNLGIVAAGTIMLNTKQLAARQRLQGGTHKQPKVASFHALNEERVLRSSRPCLQVGIHRHITIGKLPHSVYRGRLRGPAGSACKAGYASRQHTTTCISWAKRFITACNSRRFAAGTIMLNTQHLAAQQRLQGL
jgi:hypothetical protein